MKLRAVFVLAAATVAFGFASVGQAGATSENVVSKPPAVLACWLDSVYTYPAGNATRKRAAEAAAASRTISLIGSGYPNSYYEDEGYAFEVRKCD